MQGIAAGLDIEGSGKVEYVIHDQQGSPIILTLDAYFTPKLHSNLHLLSPQKNFTKDGDRALFSCPTIDEQEHSAFLEIKPITSNWIDADPLNVVIIEFDPKSWLPVALAWLPEANQFGEFFFCALSQSQEIESKLNATVCLTEKANANLTFS